MVIDLAVRRLVTVVVFMVALGSRLARPTHAQHDEGATGPITLTVKSDDKGTVHVRGEGFEKRGKPGQPIELPTEAFASVLVRVDFGKDDFYEAFVELGPGPAILTVPSAKGGAIIAGKKRIPLSRGVPLTTFATDPRVSLDVEGGEGMPCAGPRYLAPGKKGVRIEQVIVHASLTDTLAEALAAHLARSLSTHFLIDRDGAITQAVDLDRTAYHAGERNTFGVGVDLVGRLDNLAFTPPQPDLSWPVDPIAADPIEAERAVDRAAGRAHAPNAGVTDPTLVLPLSGPARINHALVQSYGFSARATRSLEALMLALWRAYPTLARSSSEAMSALERPEVSGVLTHWQTESVRWDPGPGFDLARLNRLSELVRALGP